MTVVRTKLYAHRDKDSNWTQWDEMVKGLDGDFDVAGSRFAYTGLEVAMDCEINLETGEVKVTHFEGAPLPNPVTI